MSGYEMLFNVICAASLALNVSLLVSMKLSSAFTKALIQDLDDFQEENMQLQSFAMKLLTEKQEREDAARNRWYEEMMALDDYFAKAPKTTQETKESI